jgi:hypothetical protein
MEKVLAPHVIKTAHEISEALIKMEAPIVMGSVPKARAKNPKSN